MLNCSPSPKRSVDIARFVWSPNPNGAYPRLVHFRVYTSIPYLRFFDLQNHSHIPFFNSRTFKSQCLLHIPQSTCRGLPPFSSPIERAITLHHYCGLSRRLARSPPLIRPTSPSTLHPTRPPTTATTTHRQAGSSVFLQARSTKMRVGRIRGCMGSGAVWPWGLWLMLISRIRRKSFKHFFLRLWRVWRWGKRLWMHRRIWETSSAWQEGVHGAGDSTISFGEAWSEWN